MAVIRPPGGGGATSTGPCNRRPLAYIASVEFEWDEAKSEACYAERGFDFAHAVRVFLDRDRLIEPDDRFDYGEPRQRVFGRIEGRVFVVVYTPSRPTVPLDLGAQGKP